MNCSCHPSESSIKFNGSFPLDCADGFYKGELGHRRFAYQLFRDQANDDGNILSFFHPAKLNNVEFPDALHIAWELPRIGLFAGTCFERLFLFHVGNLLTNYTADEILFVDGALFKDGKQLTITTRMLERETVIGHTTLSLAQPSTEMIGFIALQKDHSVALFEQLESSFYTLLKSIKRDCTLHVL
jgi:hypothetical protein